MAEKDTPPTSVPRDDDASLQLLGVCPLAALSASVVSGIGLGLATLAVLCVTGLFGSAIARRMPPGACLPGYLLIAAATVATLQMLCEAFLFDVFITVGLLIPLLVTNGTILGQAEDCAARRADSFADTRNLARGIALALLLVVLGSAREFLGTGTLLSGVTLLVDQNGPSTAAATASDAGFTLAVVPAGGFLAMALLLAARNALADRRRRTAR